MILLTILAVVVLVLLSAFFSGSETGLISVDRFLLEKQARQDQSKRELLDFLNRPEKVLGTTLLGNNITLVLLTTVATAFLLPQLQHFAWVRKYVSEPFPLVLAAFILLFGEIIPKAVYREHANPLIIRTFPLLRVFAFIMAPLNRGVRGLDNFLGHLFGVEREDEMQSFTREDLSYILSETRYDKDLAQSQRDMLEEALEFNELEANDLMIPRTKVSAVPQSMPVQEVINKAREEGYTRYPVYEGSIDNVVGVLIIYDLLSHQDPNGPVKDFMRPKAFHAPETIDVASLLAEMQKLKVSLAIIVDQYGGTAGIATVEDIIEEIVGDIADEYDKDEPIKDLIRLNDNTFELSGFIEIDRLEDEYEIILPQGNYNTIAGLMIDRLRNIPAKGQKLKLDNCVLEVLEATSSKVEKVKLTITTPPVNVN